MIEVFKTNVNSSHHANILLHEIHNRFSRYTANFDLTDCDNILRVKCSSGAVEPELLIDLLRQHGFHAEVLPDEIVFSAGSN